VSVGALMTMCVVVSSFVLTPDRAGWQLVLGVLAVIGVALVVGTINVILIRGLGLSSIIATLAMLSILDGISLWLRPQPDGLINSGFINFMLKSIGFVPIAFIVIVVVAFGADVWLYRSPGGLAARATGLDEQAADRRGVRVRLLFVRAFFITAFAAAVLGGASLFGGRGSFIGAVVGALFLNVVINVLPFLGWSASYGRIMVGALTLVALAFYQAPELLARGRMFVANLRLSRAAAQPAPGPAE
jgi:ribose transport system ATP-binding protein